MATGRGWIHQQHTELVQKSKPGPATLLSTKPRQTSYLKGQQRCTKIANERLAKTSKNKNVVKQFHHIETAYIERIPSEVILKIFSYLDPITLMYISCVNKKFCELSKDNLLWYKMLYQRNKLCSKYGMVKPIDKTLNETTLADKEPGYWKNIYLEDLITVRKYRINHILKSAKKCNAYGVPSNIEKAIMMSGLKWSLTFKNSNGKETVIEQTDIQFRDTSLTLAWNCYVWPEFSSLTKIQLHGITPVFNGKEMGTFKNKLRKRSLIAEYDLKGFIKYIGQDDHVKLLYLHPGLMLGMWKRGSEIAFVMASLHYYQLLEKSLYGSAESPYSFPAHIPILDDIDPNYGLHGYRLHIEMYSGPRTYLCRTFRGLFCRKEYIKNGHLRMTAIGVKKKQDYAPLIGKVDFLWETMAFSGSFQNCLMMDVTLLDETETPFWCFCSPAQLCPGSSSENVFDFMGQSFYLNYKDDVGKVHAELIWMKETEEHCLINLILYISTQKVNSYFGTNYTDSTDST